MEALAAQGSSLARVVLYGLNHLSRYIAGVQVGITLAGLASGRFGEPVLAALFDPLFARLFPPTLLGAEVSTALATGLALLVISYLLVVLSELVPKAITLQYAEQVALIIAKPMHMAVVMFTPLIWSMNALGNGILRLLHLPPPEEGQGAYSVEELHLLIVQSHKAGILEDIERQLMQRSVQFADLRVTDIMIPRVDMVALDIALPEDALLDRVAQTIHTRLPVYEGTLDNMIGILHLQDVFKHVRQPKEGWSLRQLVRPALFVPEVMPLDDLLHTFQQQHAQLALVVNVIATPYGTIRVENMAQVRITQVASIPTPTTTPDAQAH